MKNYWVYISGIGETRDSALIIETTSRCAAAEEAARIFLNDNPDWADRFPLEFSVINDEGLENKFVVDLDGWEADFTVVLI